MFDYDIKYDELGRMTKETAPDGKMQTTVYDRAGRVKLFNVPGWNKPVPSKYFGN